MTRRSAVLAVVLVCARDGDTVGDACDRCLDDPANDEDGDERCASEDNCPITCNPWQGDADADGVGEACDSE